eukprot:SAG22_NODE_478_length_9967_cov_12.777260_1_plen_136_part_00
MSGREKRERKTSSKLTYAQEQDLVYLEERKKAASRPKKKKAKKQPEPKIKTIVIHKPAPGKVKLPKLNKNLTAYQLFSKAMSSRVLQDYPDATLGERSKIVSEMWSELPQDRRAAWERLSQKDKQRFDREKAAMG